MGLIDRDYMRDPDRKNPFSPPPEKPILGWLIKISVFVVLIYLGFKLATWLDVNRRSVPAQTIKVPTPEVKRIAEPASVQQPAQPTIIYPPAQSRSAEQAVITKCVVQGNVSYGDGACPVGAVASGVVTKNNHNLVAAVKMPLPVQTATLEPPLPMSAQVNPGLDYAAVKAECVALEERIKYLDSLAHQPQSGQTQDWIRSERKKARDRQFGIRCT